MSIERPKPYIGFSGIVNVGDQHYLAERMYWSDLEDERVMALGVKAVHKTQFLDIPNKYGREWYPVGEEEFATALDGWAELNVAQTYFDADHVKDINYRNEFTDRIRKRGSAWLNAIQFDMLPWHEDESMLPWLEKLKKESGLTILLQAHGEAMSELGPDKLTHTLGRYAHAFDYILFDASHGKGVRMNTEALKPFLEAAYQSGELEGVGMAVAGGLNAQVVREHLPEIVALYPDISWDAEGQLHPVRADGTRPLDLALAGAYIEASAEVLGKSK